MVDSKLRLAACRVLLDRIGRAKLWAGKGPTTAAYEHLSEIDQAPPLERVMTLVCWSIWNSRCQLKFAEILALEDPGAVGLISGYMVAASHGNTGVNAWLASRPESGAAPAEVAES